MRIVMEQAGLTFWPAFSLVIFLVVSFATLVWIYRPGSRDFYRKMSDLALEDGQDGSRTSPKTPKPSAEE